MKDHPRLLETIEAHATRTPSAVAVVHRDRPITYPVLLAEVGAVATWLCAQGFRAGETVGITVRDEYRYLLACLATIRIGCRHVCLPSFDPAQSRARIAERLTVSRHLIDVEAYAIPGLPSVLLPALDALPAADPDRLGPHSASDTSAIIFTSSGTTGKAKLIEVDQPGLFESARLFSNPPKNLALAAPLEHNLPKLNTLRILIFGGSVILSSVRDCFDLREMCRRFDVTHMLLFAFSAKALLGEIESLPGPRPILPDLIVTLSGSRIGLDLIHRFQANVTPKTVVTYGAMEVGLISRATAADLERNGESVGFPAPGVSVQIVDEQDRVLPAGETGRIRISSSACATRYLDDEEASRRAFRDGWFQPGDLGMMTEDGMLVFRGRADDMMILNSFNIFPAEIESVAETFPGVVDCAAFPMDSGLHGQIPILAVVADEALDLKALMRFCRERLGNRSARKAVQVASLPRNPAGKVLRRELETLIEAKNARA